MLALMLVGLVTAAPGFPRVGNLWGTGLPAGDPATWTRYDLMVVGGGSPESIRAFREQAQARNPGAILLSTGPLMNLGAPEATPWMREEWYVHAPDGKLIRWWADQVCTPNILLPECLDAILAQTDKPYGAVLADRSLDGMFYDSVVGRATWLGDVDTDRDGRADDPAVVDPKWHAAQCAFFDRLGEKWPEIRVLANDVDLDHAPHINGRLFEGATLLDRVANGTLSAEEAIATLRKWMATSRQPGTTFALMTHPVGWQGWRVGKGNTVTTPGEVDRVRRDFPRMRLGLCTTLMSDAYYGYDLGTVWYGLPLWYAEYDAPLGAPKDEGRPVYEVPPVPVLEWSRGRPTEGLILDAGSAATPDGIRCARPEGATGWARLVGTDLRRIPLRPGKAYQIEADCVVVARPSGLLQFNVRTAAGGWEHHDKGVSQCAEPAGSEWKVRTTVVPDDFPDYSVEWHLNGSGELLIRSLRISLVEQCYWRREFEGGTVLLNPLPAPVDIRLPAPRKKLLDDQAPLHGAELDDEAPAFSAVGAWEKIGGQGTWVGNGWHRARKPGETATWRFISPSTDRYSVHVSVPASEGLTDAAVYHIQGPGASIAGVLDQRAGDAGWVRVLEADLREGETYTITLSSGGAGATAADGVRLESAARWNDGSRVEHLLLPPMDGAVLVNE